MESAKPSVYAKSNSEGLDRVRKEDGMYAFFMEAAAIEYHIERFCDLKQLGGLLDSKGYGIALPKGEIKFLQIQFSFISYLNRLTLHCCHLRRGAGLAGEGEAEGAEIEVVEEGEGRRAMHGKKYSLKLQTEF